MNKIICILTIITAIGLSQSSLRATAAQEEVEDMIDDGYGLFVHWKKQTVAGPGQIDVPDWNDRVDGFDVVGFADAAELSGAKWVTFTIIHGDLNLPFPLEYWEGVFPGQASERDLMSEMYDELSSRGIELYFYMAPRTGFGQYPDVDTWIEGVYNLFEAISLKYEDKVSGWWIDNLGSTEGKLLDKVALADALRAGNPDAMLGFHVAGGFGNPLNPYSNDVQNVGISDYTAGHLKPENLNLRRAGSTFDRNGLASHRSGRLDTNTGLWYYNGTNEGAMHTETSLLEYVADMRRLGVTMTWNLAPYQDGTLSDTAINVLKTLGLVMREGFDYVSNTDGVISYSTDWGSANTADDSATDYSVAVSSVQGSSAVFSFDGARAMIMGKKTPSGGNAEVYLDGALVHTLSTYDAVETHQVLFYDTGELSKGSHTLEVKVSGTKDAASSGFDVNFDHILYVPEFDADLDGGDPAWSYSSGWNSQVRAASHDGTIHYSNTPGEVASFAFTGDRFNLYTQKSSGGGMFDVEVDGKWVATVDTYAATLQHQAHAYASERLLPGLHTVEITVRADANPNAANKWVHVDLAEVNETVPLGYEIDALHPDIDYSASWSVNEHESALGDYIAVANADGDSAKYTFVGTGIDIISRLTPNGGMCRVLIDGTEVATVDTYAAEVEHQALIFSDQSLTLGTHTVELVVSGTSNPNSGASNVHFDRLYITPGERGQAAHWSLDDGSGTVVLDGSGSGFDATMSGATWVAGLDGNALEFDGSASTVSLPVDAFASIGDEVTISMWVYGGDNQPRQDSVFEAVNAAGQRVLNIHLPWSNGTVFWDAGNAGGFERIGAVASEADYKGQWNHWTFTKHAGLGEMKIYLNGELFHSERGMTHSMSGITAASLGSLVDGTLGYEGVIDDVRIYDTSFTSAEVSELTYSYTATQGVPKVWLIANGIEPTDAGALADADGDGVPNWEEYQNGTDAVNSPGIRSTEYYLSSGDFTGTDATLVLDQQLADNYFILVRGSRVGDGPSMPDNDYVRVTSVPFGSTRYPGSMLGSGSGSEIKLSRAAADVDWEGVVTVVECSNSASEAGFKLVDIVSTDMIDTSGTDTCTAWGDINQVVLFGGYRGGARTT